MEVEYVTGIGLAAWRLAGEQRKLAMGRGMLRQIVDDDQCVLPPVPEIFGDWSPPEERSSLARAQRVDPPSLKPDARGAAETLLAAASEHAALVGHGRIWP